ncbi:MAG: hypothetical protein M3463_01265, partial [Verrucomicrobiota bacterium]|nr:hypothetical protein [Verrucomicrobiota bacterium]
DLPGAIAYARSLPEGLVRSEALGDLTPHLVKSDPLAALQSLEAMPEGKARQDATEQIALQWSQSDPKAAVDYLLKTHRGEISYISPLATAVRNWVESAPTEVLEWSWELPEGPFKPQVAATAVEALASIDPVAAAKHVNELSGESHIQAAAGLAGGWVSKEPLAAANWAASLPNAAARKKAVVALMVQWSDMDLPGATKWLEGLPPGETREAGVREMVHHLADFDPAAALARVGMIADEKSRQEVIREAARTWLAIDPGAAKKWIESNALLTPETRRALLREARSLPPPQRE